MSNKFPLAKILILVIILAVPGFLYYLLQSKGENRYKPLPIFGPKEVATTFTKKRGKKIPDTIFHVVKSFEATNQNGNKVVIDSIKKQLIVVNFFYSRSKDLVPQMYTNIKWLNQEFKDNKIVRFLSISVDPVFDNQSVLAQYAKQNGALSGKWDFLSADTNVVYPLARNQFFLNALENKQTGEFIHSEKLVLLDAEHRIRGYYDATSAPEVKKMGDEMKILITEELRKIKAEF
jgi:protein SCO1/2